jgi:hypothetical protein
MGKTYYEAAVIFAILAVSACSNNRAERAPRAERAQGAEGASELAARSIAIPENATSSRLPQFLAWPTRVDINDRSACEGGKRLVATNTLAADFRGDLHSDFLVATKGALNDSLGFYYDPLAALRLCGPVVVTSPIQGRIPTLYDGTVNRWIAEIKVAGRSVPKSIEGAFPEGARAATAIWYRLKRNTHPLLQLSLPADPARLGGNIVMINVPEVLLASSDCSVNPAYPEPDSPQLPQPQGAPLDLNDFYWVQLNRNDRVTGGNCGDIEVLVGFHLIEKVSTVPEKGLSGWLWATYWWSDQDKTRDHIVPLSNTAHQGPDPVRWENYVIASTLRSDQAIINPWKEKSGSNCAFCHSFAFYPIATTDQPKSEPLTDAPHGTMRADFIFAGPIREDGQPKSSAK